MPLDDYDLRTRDLALGVTVLQKRQQKLQCFAMLSGAVLLCSGISFFFQQQLVYSFFGLSETVEHLHIPVSVELGVLQSGGSPDYFGNLLIWFAWLFFKIFASFIGAFIVVHVLKYFACFRRRFQSFILKFVGWLIAFILIWTGVSLWQHESRSSQQALTEDLVEYRSNIQNSAIGQYLTESENVPAVKAYVLAQTALLQTPADLTTAKPFVAQLIEAESKDPRFDQYGFQAEQIWTMQQQTYGKTMTPIAQQVSPQVVQADQMYQVISILMMVITALLALLSVILWLLSQSLKKRLHRIGGRLTE